MRQPSLARLATATLAVALVAGVSACGSPGQDPDAVTLDFFQFKPEAADTFDAIVADFEAANPDIDVVVNTVPDPDTAIRALLVKGKTPDVLTLNGSGNFGLLAKAGVFHDFTGDPVLERINPGVQDILGDLGTFEGREVNALGFSSNANGILYNREIFAEHGLEPPQTWAELIDVCERLEAAGVTPFYGTLADAWTTQPSFNGLGAYAAQDGFFDDLRAEGADVGPDAPVSFERDFDTTLTRMQQAYTFVQDGYRGRTYDDGNAALANGEVAMLMQGIWATSQIQAVNPDIDLGVFPYPADDAGDTLLVSGVDVAVTIGRDTPHLAEAKRFVDYLFTPEVLDRYAAEQHMFSPSATSTGTDDPMLAELQPYFDDGRITGFIDHQVPPSIPLAAVLQQGIFDGDGERALATLDNEWRKVAARTGE
ncbi:ABC transporter substrate-binding protein [Myceligenerans indicum]|uniref:Extracellular solute-binding protein n=1 Tax=Myceligenerans indicum TaxID=2593663 RepID=A0ABS1LJL5_9MICO|nr:extracellular solute-binding protein [Myceligenerans indicum]MBL0886435.1 extracellular solute-binding protein [Myceligenerans indicum]